MDYLKNILTVLIVLAMFVGILYLTYVTTKFIGKRYSVNGKNFKNLKVLETIAVGPDRQLMIVKTAGKYLLLGATPHNISLITELDGTQITDTVSDDIAQPMSFTEALKKVTKEKFSKKDTDFNEEDNHNGEEG